MDWIKALFDITKLPSKFFAWGAALSGVYIFVPSPVLTSMHLDNLPTEWNRYAGLVFFGSISILAINLLMAIGGWIGRWFGKRRKLVLLVEAITNLDSAEFAVLREFFIQDRNVIELPIDHPTVAGLIHKNFITLKSAHGYRSLAGNVFPVGLSTAATKLVSAEIVGIPLELSEADIARLRDKRPNFLADIERQDRLRSGSPW